MNPGKMLLAALLVLSWSVVALDDREQKIADRLAPPGETCMAGDACAEAPAAVAVSGDADASATTAAQDPAQIYATSCQLCHANGVAEAPIMGDAAVWSERVSSGIEAVYNNAINGVGAMPPRGTCANCSDDDIKAVVDYIVSQSQ